MPVSYPRWYTLIRNVPALDTGKVIVPALNVAGFEMGPPITFVPEPTPVKIINYIIF